MSPDLTLIRPFLPRQECPDPPEPDHGAVSALVARVVAVVIPPSGWEVIWVIILIYLIAFGVVFWLGVLTAF